MPAHGAAHHCTPQESFLIKASPEIAGLHATGMTLAFADASPAPVAAPLQPRADDSPPLPAPPPTVVVLRI